MNLKTPHITDHVVWWGKSRRREMIELPINAALISVGKMYGFQKMPFITFIWNMIIHKKMMAPISTAWEWQINIKLTQEHIKKRSINECARVGLQTIYLLQLSWAVFSCAKPSWAEPCCMAAEMRWLSCGLEMSKR